MIGTESNHCQTLLESLKGTRSVDEKTLASLAILSERLERLKELDSCFADVTFSAAVKKLVKQKNKVAIG